MKISLYQNLSETNAVNKNLLFVVSAIGNLRKGTSILTPVIELQSDFNIQYSAEVVDEDNDDVIDGDGVDVVYQTEPLPIVDVNYIYIEEFNRYYFVDNINVELTNYFIFYLRCDVLMSYKNKVLDLNAFITRNEFTYNDLLKDDRISFYYNKVIDEYKADKGNMVNTTFSSTEVLPSFTNCALSVINDKILLSKTTITSPDVTLPNVDNIASGQSLVCRTYCCNGLNVTRLARRILNDDTLANFVLSGIILPFKIDNDEDAEYLRLGDTDIDGVDGVRVYDITPNLSKYYVIADFKIESEGTFLEYEPYTQYEIWLPYLSWVKVNADDILDNRIIVYYVVDFLTGNAQVTIYDVTNGRNIFTSNCQLGVKIGFSSTNAREVKDNQTSNNIGLSVGLLSSALAFTGGVTTANPIVMGGALISGGNVIANYFQNQNINYNRASGSISSSNGGLYASQDVRIRKTKLIPKEYGIDFAKLYGKPLNEYVRIGDLSGYTEVGEIHIEDIGSITETEYNELHTLLKEGIIL